MSSSARFLAVILFLVWCMPVSLLAQTPAKSTARIARGSVSGRVTIKDKPVSGVMIGLRQNVNGMPESRVYRAVTDQEGYLSHHKCPSRHLRHSARGSGLNLTQPQNP